MNYKAISLLQPWATLVVLGHKKIETRSWNTKHRGLLLIHASVNPKFVKTTEFSCCSELIEELDDLNMLTQDDYPYPYGAIIGAVNLTDTFQFSARPEDQLSEYRGTANPWVPFREGGNDFESLQEAEEWERNICRELAFGDYGAGRYGWMLETPVAFPNILPCKGSLSLWTPPPSICTDVEAALQSVREGGDHVR